MGLGTGMFGIGEWQDGFNMQKKGPERLDNPYPTSLNPNILENNQGFNQAEVPGLNPALLDATSMGEGGVTQDQFQDFSQNYREPMSPRINESALMSPLMSYAEEAEVPSAASGAQGGTQGNKPWGGLLGPDTKWGKKIGDFGKKGGLLGMAMKGMGVENAGGIMGQFTGAMSGMLGGGQQSAPQQDYTSEVQNAASFAPPSYQRQQGSFY